MELIHSLSADALLLALNDLFSQIGTPKSIFSDNGSNFRRVCKEIALEFPIKRDPSKTDIIWTFSPPMAPWFNASAERLIGCVKNALKIFSDRFKSQRDLRSFLLQAVSTINSRTLFFDEHDRAVTPIMLWQQRSSNTLISPANPAQNLKLRPSQNWKMLQKSHSEFQQRWLKFYRNALALSDAKGKRTNIARGDILLVPDDTKDRLAWSKGIVEETFPDRDGIVRIVKIRTATGTYRRATNGMLKCEMNA